MVDWMNQSDAQDAAIGEDIGALGNDIRGDMAEFRHHTAVEFATMRVEMTEFGHHTATEFATMRAEMAEFGHHTATEFATVRAEMRVQFADVHAKFDTKFAEINAKFTVQEAASAQRHADFMKWTLGFWAVSLITMLGAIAALARTLARP
jgi:hypothetical protein